MCCTTAITVLGLKHERSLCVPCVSDKEKSGDKAWVDESAKSSAFSRVGASHKSVELKVTSGISKHRLGQ